MKVSVFGGYDRQETDALLEELQEKTNQANLRAAELETQLAESKRTLAEREGELAQQLAMKERHLAELEQRLGGAEVSMAALREENDRLQQSLEEYERKIEKVGQIYITAYDEAEKITAGAKQRTSEAIDVISEAVKNANQNMKRQLSHLIMAKESLKETLASVNQTMQQSFEVFTQQALNIDDVLMDADTFAERLREDSRDAYSEPVPRNDRDDSAEAPLAAGQDFVELFQEQNAGSSQEK